MPKNIYVSHSTSHDYKKELYEPIRDSKLNECFHVVLPHEHSDDLYNPKDYLKQCNYMICEISYKSTGSGIEMGWADAFSTKIIGIYKKGTTPSLAAKEICNTLIEYDSIDDMIYKLEIFILT